MSSNNHAALTPATTPLLTPAQAADWMGLKTDTLRDWRRTGLGPKWISISRKTIRYRLADLVAFAAQREVRQLTPERFRPVRRNQAENLPRPDDDGEYLGP
jgi:hypothetical protein